MVSIAKCPPRDIAHILYARELVGSVQSGDTTVRRTLKSMQFRKEVKLEKIGKRGVYMLPNLTGFRNHDEMLTKAFVELWKHWDVDIRREMLVEQVGLRPDGICLVKNGDKKSCLIIEAVNFENEIYFNQKKSTWEGWAGAKEFLSELFGVKIPYFHLITYGREMPNSITLEDAISRMLAQ